MNERLSGCLPKFLRPSENKSVQDYSSPEYRQRQERERISRLLDSVVDGLAITDPVDWSNYHKPASENETTAIEETIEDMKV